MGNDPNPIKQTGTNFDLDAREGESIQKDARSFRRDLGNFSNDNLVNQVPEKEQFPGADRHNSNATNLLSTIQSQPNADYGIDHHSLEESLKKGDAVFKKRTDELTPRGDPPPQAQVQDKLPPQDNTRPAPNTQLARNTTDGVPGGRASDTMQIQSDPQTQKGSSSTAGGGQLGENVGSAGGSVHTDAPYVPPVRHEQPESGASQSKPRIEQKGDTTSSDGAHSERPNRSEQANVGNTSGSAQQQDSAVAGKTSYNQGAHESTSTPTQHTDRGANSYPQRTGANTSGYSEDLVKA